MKEENIRAKSEQQAISRVALRLGVMEEELSCVEVEKAKKGFLGIGAEDALYKVTYNGNKKFDDEPAAVKAKPAERTEKEAPKAATAKAPAAQKPAKAVSVKSEVKNEHASAAANEDAVKSNGIEGVISFIDMILKDLKMYAHAKVTKETDEDVFIEIVGDNLGSIIGHHGEVLDSIQYLANIVNDNEKGTDRRIHIDVENYRSKREETLNRLADRMAAKVLANGRSVTLEPMNPYERRVIHSRIQGIEGVTTRSVGTDLGRKVVIYPEKGGRNDKYQVERPEYSGADGCNDRYTAPGNGR